MAVKNELEPFTRIDVHAAKEMIESGDVQVVDSRAPHELDETGHVPGALNIPHMAIVTRKGDLEAEKEHLFICSVGARSALACEFAAALGFKELYNIEGGLDAWVRSGYAVE